MTKGILKSEIIWVHGTLNDGRQYYITSKPIRDVYYLYELKNDKAIKYGQSQNPNKLEEKFRKEK